MKIQLFIIPLFVFISLSILNTLRINQELKNYNESQYEAYFTELETIKNNLKRVSDSIFDNLINVKDVIDIFQKAHSASIEEKALLRQQLYELLQTKYKKFQKYGVQQFHFHLPNNDSFLRFHKPEKFGDDLTQIRASVKYVNEFKKAIVGFEEGRIFNGYRYVYPLFDKNGTHIGSVEVSSSLLNFKKMFEATNSVQVDFVLTKQVVYSKVFESQLKNYVQYLTFENFLIQSTLQEYNTQKYIHTNLTAILKDKEIESQLLPIHKFIYSKFVNEDLYSFFFIPLYNDFTKQPVGYSIILGESNYFKYFFDSLIFSYLAIALISLLLAFTLFKNSQLIKENEEKLFFKHESYTDTLTSLPNRKAYERRLQEKINLSKRYNTIFSIILYDIDKFKLINDTYGHDIGDKVLIEMSQLIRSTLRANDYIFRIGGEEFIIILPHTRNIEAKTTAEKIRKEVETQLHSIENKTITISMGVTQYKIDDNAKTIFKRVDDYLYESKKNGRNRVTSDEEFIEGKSF